MFLSLVAFNESHLPQAIRIDGRTNGIGIVSTAEITAKKLMQSVRVEDVIEEEQWLDTQWYIMYTLPRSHNLMGAEAFLWWGNSFTEVTKSPKSKRQRCGRYSSSVKMEINSRKSQYLEPALSTRMNQRVAWCWHQGFRSLCTPGLLFSIPSMYLEAVQVTLRNPKTFQVHKRRGSRHICISKYVLPIDETVPACWLALKKLLLWLRPLMFNQNKEINSASRASLLLKKYLDH